MANLTWKSGATGAFNAATNWNEGVAPQSGDTATIATGVARIVGENGDVLPSNLSLTDGVSASNTSVSPSSVLSLTDTSVTSTFALNETLPGGSYQGGSTGPVLRSGIGIHGTVNFAGTINVGAGDTGNIGIDGSKYSSNTGFFNNTGTINVTGSGSNLALQTVSAGSDEGNSTAGIYANYGTVNIKDAVFVARVTDLPLSGAATGTSVFNLSNGSYIRFENDMHTNTTVNLLDGSNERIILAPDANNQVVFGGTINGFRAGDKIGLVNTAAVGSMSYDDSSHVLQVIDTSGNVITKLGIAGDFSSSVFSASQNPTPTSTYTSEYDITVRATSSGSSGTGTPTVASMEFGQTITDPSTPTGGVYGLYEGLLHRAPDALGLENFSAVLTAGASLTDVASAILASSEHGPAIADPTTYVQSLYANTLHRAADGGGLSYYTNELKAGLSQAQVAVQIATSPEAQSVSAPAFQTGVFVTDAIDAGVARLYYGLLGRTPDANGLAGFETQVQKGATSGGFTGAVQGLSNVATAMLGSSEYAASHVGQTDAGYVDGLYVGALGRHAETAGASFYAAELAQGVSKAVVALQIAESPEAQTHLVSQIELGWHLV